MEDYFNRERESVPARGERRVFSLANQGKGKERVYPAFTEVDGVGRCETVRKVGFVKAIGNHVRLVIDPSMEFIAVYARRRRGITSWCRLDNPQKYLTVEERSHKGRRAKVSKRK